MTKTEPKAEPKEESNESIDRLLENFVKEEYTYEDKILPSLIKNFENAISLDKENFTKPQNTEDFQKYVNKINSSLNKFCNKISNKFNEIKEKNTVKAQNYLNNRFGFYFDLLPEIDKLLPLDPGQPIIQGGEQYADFRSAQIEKIKLLSALIKENENPALTKVPKTIELPPPGPLGVGNPQQQQSGYTPSVPQGPLVFVNPQRQQPEFAPSAPPGPLGVDNPQRQQPGFVPLVPQGPLGVGNQQRQQRVHFLDQSQQPQRLGKETDLLRSQIRSPHNSLVFNQQPGFTPSAPQVRLVFVNPQQPQRVHFANQSQHPQPLDKETDLLRSQRPKPPNPLVFVNPQQQQPGFVPLVPQGPLVFVNPQRQQPGSNPLAPQGPLGVGNPQQQQPGFVPLVPQGPLGVGNQQQPQRLHPVHFLDQSQQPQPLDKETDLLRSQRPKPPNPLVFVNPQRQQPGLTPSAPQGCSLVDNQQKSNQEFDPLWSNERKIKKLGTQAILQFRNSKDPEIRKELQEVLKELGQIEIEILNRKNVQGKQQSPSPTSTKETGGR